jgi:uncharacterized MAPEG superfamily protein
MTIALWCVFAAGILPYLATVTAKAGLKNYDNNAPRAGLDQLLQGYRARAYAAQLNGFEAFPLFAAAVIIAQVLRGPLHQVDVLALVFVAARILYLFLYLGAKGTFRSLTWGVGFFCVIAIFIIAAR